MKCLACFEGSTIKLFSFLIFMIKELQRRTEMAWWCRTMAALGMDWSLTPSTPMQLVTASNSSFRGSSAFFWLPQTLLTYGAYTQMQAKYQYT